MCQNVIFHIFSHSRNRRALVSYFFITCCSLVCIVDFNLDIYSLEVFKKHELEVWLSPVVSLHEFQIRILCLFIN